MYVPSDTGLVGILGRTDRSGIINISLAITCMKFVRPSGQSDPDLDDLRQRWLGTIRPKFEPDIDADPYLSPPDVDKLLKRSLGFHTTMHNATFH